LPVGMKMLDDNKQQSKRDSKKQTRKGKNSERENENYEMYGCC